MDLLGKFDLACHLLLTTTNVRHRSSNGEYLVNMVLAGRQYGDIVRTPRCLPVDNTMCAHGESGVWCNMVPDSYEIQTSTMSCDS